MEGATTRKKLGDDSQVDQMNREQHMKPTHSPRRPWTRVASQESSRDRANKLARRASTDDADAEINQGFKYPDSCAAASSANPSTSGQEARVAAHRKFRSGFTACSSLRPFTCYSPSTDSTTSLQQLRDKLTVLSPLVFNKVPCKIATSPELPVLNEHDERENLSNGLSNTKRCGVALKYHSDGEAQAQRTKKTRRFSPIVEEHSASLVLVAALGNADSSVTNEVFQALYKDNPNYDLVDILVAEALQHGQEKDSGIISGKVTQDSDVVENTPLEKEVRHKLLSTKRNAKSIAQNNPTFEESEVEVIEDTPCYVYDRKERVRTNNKKADKIISEEIVTLDETAVDAFFSQHVNQNNRENVISSTFAKKINDTSSEDSDDDCIIVEDHRIEEELSLNNLAVDADVADCVNSAIDKVCNDLDKYTELQAEQERDIDNLRFPKNNIEEYNSNMNTPKMNTRKKAAKNYKYPMAIGKCACALVESTNTSSPLNSKKATATQKKRKLYSPQDDENENQEITTPKTRVERRQSNVNQTPIATCYRDLENARQSNSRISKKSRASIQAKKTKKSRYNMSNESDGEGQSFKIRLRTRSSSTGSTTRMSRRERSMKIVNYTDEHYSAMDSSSEDDDFKHNRAIKPKTARTIKPRSRKVAKTKRTQPILSPKTKQLNEMFDKIKGDVVNDEKITLVEKKSVENGPYNLSSESEDGDFKKKKNEVQKRISASSLESSATKRRRLMSRVNCSKYCSSDDEDKRTQKSKTVKRAKPRSCKTNKIPKLNLIDERMRVAQQETLQTSFVKDTVDTNDLEEPEPALQQTPVLEDMPPDKTNDDESKTCENVRRSIATKKNKEITKTVSKEQDSAPVSPLPGLVVETERTRRDDLTSSIEANLLQKLKKICIQRFLLKADENDDAVLEPTEIIETALVSDVLSEISIATGGRSPITAHNDLNESPPNVELLDEEFQHRDVHNEGMSESMKEFLTNMRNTLQINEPTASLTSPVIRITRMSTKESARSNLCAERMLSEESVHKSITYAESNKSNSKVVVERIPTLEIESKLDSPGTPKSKISSVVLTRMSSEEIVEHTSSTHTKKTSDTGSPKIVLERLSPDEINKWLPMPESKDVTGTGEKHKKYSMRQTSKPTKTKIPTKRQTSKPAETKTPIKRNIKPKISPVKLSFDIVDLTMSADDRVRRVLRTRCSTKSTKSNATHFDKESLKTAQTSKNDQSFIKNSPETSKSLVVTRSKPDTAPASADRCDANRSVASVEDWLHRNATLSSPSARDNHINDEILCQLMETLQTTLVEIHQATVEGLTAVFLKEEEKKICLEKEIHDYIKRKIAERRKSHWDGACEVLRANAEKTARMVKLIQEDIQRIRNQHRERHGADNGSQGTV